MGGGGGFLGLGGGGSKPDTSAYERQLAEQKAATEAKEAETARKQAESDAAYERQIAGRANTILTGVGGDASTKAVKRKTLLGA